MCLISFPFSAHCISKGDHSALGSNCKIHHHYQDRKEDGRHRSLGDEWGRQWKVWRNSVRPQHTGKFPWSLEAAPFLTPALPRACQAGFYQTYGPLETQHKNTFVCNIYPEGKPTSSTSFPNPKSHCMGQLPINHTLCYPLLFGPFCEHDETPNPSSLVQDQLLSLPPAWLSSLQQPSLTWPFPSARDIFPLLICQILSHSSVQHPGQRTLSTKEHPCAARNWYFNSLQSA